MFALPDAFMAEKSPKSAMSVIGRRRAAVLQDETAATATTGISTPGAKAAPRSASAVATATTAPTMMLMIAPVDTPPPELLPLDEAAAAPGLQSHCECSGLT